MRSDNPHTGDLKTQSLPEFYEKLLLWCVPAELQSPIMGDCCEEFSARNNSLQAHIWLSRQTLSLLFRFMSTTQKGTLMFAIAVTALIAVFAMTLYLGGGISIFINVPSMLIVLPPALIFAWISSPPTVFKQAFACLFNDQRIQQLEDNEAHAAVFSVMGKTAMLMGWFGVVSGAISMVSHLTPDIFADAVGPATAVTFLTLMYAFIIKALCYLAELKLSVARA